MRAIIQLNDYDADEIFGGTDTAFDIHADERSVVEGIETEWYPYSGNIHIIDDDVVQVAETVAGDVLVICSGDAPPHLGIENAELVTVYADA